MAELTQTDGAQLLEVVARALDQCVADGTQLQVDPSDFDASVQQEAASFVTLRREDGSLRGCMGSSAATRPLICDVAINTHAAASRDPRFAPLTLAERPGLEPSVSVLSALEPLHVTDTDDLVRQLRPGVDGLLLVDGRHRGTLLPAVWDVIAEPERFVTEVKAKAGWAPDYWSSTLAAFRYTAQSFGPS
ncbi:MAG: AmmeMemoRadiSam system protein A [Gemmatimonadetes bacterium]|nr:AmmeMemoRadiSam system protein A [Gemmatimonadota bacterium]MBT4611490.1 AmmeMemoRadiSam system protein A [Gemmatimonadota bacterium]MBT5058233.1 AmmeMemoRadiSam system protein A [Gemmatimonadota bacterium]MBT5142330.1 AmmeMemoRadiSam system protein A [Gemmatimonadota bacterium]MBT5591137.1 AmmeMemoRadiSam system protein A [Gemmatimonadota bacterium]